MGQPAKPLKLVVRLFILQHMYGLSDAKGVHRWVENPYWQYFCGYEFWHHALPIYPTSLIRWGSRLSEAGFSEILRGTIVAAVLTGAVKKS
ncbi:transposase [Neochlamydia sp. AcF84]|uniref:transposase n=1 Tax=Neochlamydia sp. AcF84 TaxID=2315858 RepID=UPI00325B63FC